MPEGLDTLNSKKEKVFIKVREYSKKDKSWVTSYGPYNFDGFDYDVTKVEFLVTDMNVVAGLVNGLLEYNNHEMEVKIVIVDYNVTEISSDALWALEFDDDELKVKFDLVTPKLKFIPESVMSNIDTYINCYSLAESDVGEKYTDDRLNFILSIYGHNIGLTNQIKLENDPDTAPEAKWLAENLGVHSQEELEAFGAKNINQFLKIQNVEINRDEFKTKYIRLDVNFINPIMQPWWTGVKMNSLTLEGEKQISELLDQAHK